MVQRSELQPIYQDILPEIYDVPNILYWKMFGLVQYIDSISVYNIYETVLRVTDSWSKQGQTIRAIDLKRRG